MGEEGRWAARGIGQVAGEAWRQLDGRILGIAGGGALGVDRVEVDRGGEVGMGASLQAGKGGRGAAGSDAEFCSAR